MSPKNLITTIISIFFTACLFSQVVSDLNTNSVSELDAIQLPSGAWLCSSMEITPSIGLGYRGAVHRSLDNGNTWAIEDSFEVDSTYNSIGDPVMALDMFGRPHLLFMAHVKTSEYNVHLSLFVSEDEGENWELVSRPYEDTEFSDTPHLVIDENNIFYISYTEFQNSDIFPSVTHVIKSEDGGLSWTQPNVFDSSQSDGDVGAYMNFSKSNQLNLVFNDYFMPYTYFTSSQDEGVTWSEIIELPNTEDFSINKIVCNKNSESICVFTHRAHNPRAGIHLSHSQDNGLSWNTDLLIANSIMAEGYMDDNDIVHFTYNQIEDNTFSLNYMYSNDGGVSFEEPLVLFQSFTPIQSSEYAMVLAVTGESQSLILGQDNMFHITFIDWSDLTRAKHLVFEPFDPLTMSQVNVEPSYGIKLFPNPSSDFVNIAISENDKFTEWSICDMTGKSYRQGSINSNSNTRIEVHDLTAGTYFLKVSNAELIVIKKLMVV